MCDQKFRPEKKLANFRAFVYICIYMYEKKISEKCFLGKGQKKGSRGGGETKRGDFIAAVAVTHQPMTRITQLRASVFHRYTPILYSNIEKQNREKRG